MKNWLFISPHPSLIPPGGVKKMEQLSKQWVISQHVKVTVQHFELQWNVIASPILVRMEYTIWKMIQNKRMFGKSGETSEVD